jgi:hypothetical protein
MLNLFKQGEKRIVDGVDVIVNTFETNELVRAMA